VQGKLRYRLVIFNDTATASTSTYTLVCLTRVP
jgi:hypothetical protein